jgi:hypothetical protein
MEGLENFEISTITLRGCCSASELQTHKLLEGLEGAAPSTFWLKARCSTVELQARATKKAPLMGCFVCVGL